ncbi:methionine--tRNA ligase [Patescibacteria group bacterium]|nr:methionine--tRNA ligase [Patescibacteria group bacterium]
MLRKKKKFYLTTAIDYINAPPHCGHALEKIQADVIARYHRLLGEEVFFLTGTDENSLKNVQAAKEEGIPVKKLVDRNAKRFYELKKALNLSFNDFIRTTEERHIKGAQKLWLACKKDIYKKTYRGLYCLGCEEFYQESELEDGLCPEHKTKPELVEEENHFFRLSEYQNQLKKIIEDDEVEIIPETRKNEVLSFINQGLEDICISRSAKRAHGWGINVPGDPSQKVWVWLEALSNYINALGYGENGENFQKFWQRNENKLHVIGKGIIRFHALYWPAFLLSAGLPSPNKIFVHGYLTIGGQKMSKSLGNIVDPFELVKKYGTDPVRYFLLREIPSTEDGDFTYDKFEQRYNSDLAKGLGNLVARTFTMVEKYCNGRVPEIDKDPDSHPLRIDKKIHNWKKAWQDVDNSLTVTYQFNEALSSIWKFITEADRYIEENRPWDLAQKRKKKELNWILYGLLDAIHQIAWQIFIFLPDTALKIAKALELEKILVENPNYKDSWTNIKPGTKIKKIEPLFPRI